MCWPFIHVISLVFFFFSKLKNLKCISENFSNIDREPGSP